MAKRVAIIGSAIGGGAAQIIDALSGARDQIAIAIFDKDERAAGENVLGVPVAGDSSIETLQQHHADGFFDAAVIAIGGNLAERARIFHALRDAGIPTANVIDPTAHIRSAARLGTGNVILAGTFVGPHVVLGDNCYVVGGTSIQHDSRVGNHCYFGPEVAIGGRVVIGDRVRFEIRSGAKSGLRAGDDSTISSGCILTADLAAGATALAADYVVVSSKS